jgi:hypothetical protein
VVVVAAVVISMMAAVAAVAGLACKPCINYQIFRALHQ